jgi:hypothetical protein
MGEIPGIACQWKAARRIRATQGKFVHGEFAQQNAPSRFQTRSRRRILAGHAIRHDPRTRRSADAFGVV